MRRGGLHSKLSGSGAGIPLEIAYARPVRHVYAIWVPDHDRVIQKLTTVGVQTGIHYAAGAVGLTDDLGLRTNRTSWVWLKCPVFSNAHARILLCGMSQGYGMSSSLPTGKQTRR